MYLYKAGTKCPD